MTDPDLIHRRIDVLADVQALFGARAPQWLDRPHNELGGMTPRTACESAAGLDALGRLVARLLTARDEFGVTARQAPPPVVQSTELPVVSGAVSINDILDAARQRYGAKAELWLDLPNSALDLASPSSLMTTPTGRQQIMAVLLSIPVADQPRPVEEPSTPAERSRLEARSRDELGARADQWLDRPQPLLDDRSPRQAMASRAGVGLIDRLLDEVRRVAGRWFKPRKPAQEADLQALARSVLGNTADEWLERPNPAFLGMSPLSLLGHADGRAWVADTLRDLSGRDGGTNGRRTESARLVIAGLAKDLFGTDAERWLEEPRPFLGGKSARAAMESAKGRAQVMELLRSLAEAPTPPPQPDSTPSSATILALADKVLGADADRWLDQPRNEFYGESAVFMLWTPAGRRQVMELLTEMARGEQVVALVESDGGAAAGHGGASVRLESSAPARARAPTATPLVNTGVTWNASGLAQPEADPAVIMNLARIILGARHMAWLKQPRPVFNGQSAAALMTQAEGRKLVLAVLKRVGAGEKL